MDPLWQNFLDPRMKAQTKFRPLYLQDMSAWRLKNAFAHNIRDKYQNPIFLQAQSGSTPSPEATKSTGTIVAGIVVPLVLIGIGILFFYIWYRRKYPVRMVIGKDFSKFSNPKYNKRASTLTLVRDDAESAWDIPDSPKQREHSLSLVKEDQVNGEHELNEPGKESTEASSMPKVSVTVVPEVLPPPPQVARERPRKAKLVKTIDLADDLSESAFGIVTESDLDKRTDSDISSGNDSTETHTISLSFRDTFDGRHRNTVSAVSNSTDSLRIERIDHRANSLPYDSKGYPNTAASKFEDNGYTAKTLSKSLDSQICQTGQEIGLLAENEKEFQKETTKSVIPDTENSTVLKIPHPNQTDMPLNENERHLIKDESINLDQIQIHTAQFEGPGVNELSFYKSEGVKEIDKPLTETNPFTDSDESTNDDQSFVVITEDDQDSHTIGSLKTEELTFTTSLESTNEEPVATKHINDSSFVTLCPDSIPDERGYDTTDAAGISQFDTLTDYVNANEKDISSNLTENQNEFLPEAIENIQINTIEDNVISEGTNLEGSFSQLNVLNSIPNGSSQSEDLFENNINVFKENAEKQQHPISLDSEFAENNAVDSQNIGIFENIEKTTLESDSFQSDPLDEANTTAPPLIKSEEDFTNTKTEESSNNEPVASAFNEANSSRDIVSSDINEETNENGSTSLDRRTSLTIKKDQLFLDAPPTPMIVIRDSYIYEPDSASPVLLDMKEGDNSLPGIVEKGESQSSTRSNSFDFNTWATFGQSITSINSENPEENKIQENAEPDKTSNNVDFGTILSNTNERVDIDQDVTNNLDTTKQHTSPSKLDLLDNNDEYKVNSFETVNTTLPEHSPYIFGTENEGVSTQNVVESDTLTHASPEDTNIPNTQTTLNDVDLWLNASTQSPRPIHSPTVMPSETQAHEADISDTPFLPLTVDISEEPSHLLDFGTLETPAGLKDQTNTADLVTSPMTVSTDSSAISWDVLDDISIGSKENDPFHTVKENKTNVIQDNDQNANTQQADQALQLSNIDFAVAGNIHPGNERAYSDSSSSREADTSWDLLDDSLTKTDIVNLADTNDDNDSSTA